MNFEQVFYGHGPQGYAVLGDSGCPSAQVAHAEMLCQLHGTPDAESAARLEPFLFQYHSCGRVYMGCGRMGRKDVLGRSTLFFHVLVGDGEAARTAGVCADDLFRQGLFASELGERKIEKLEVDERACRTACRGAGCSLELPVVLICRADANQKVLELIGEAATRLNWTSCSWNVTGNFDVMGVPSRKSLDSLPSGFNVYDEAGKLLRRRLESIHAEDDRTFSRNGVERIEPEPKVGGSARPSGGTGRSWLVALVVGIALGVLIGLGVAGMSGKTSVEVIRFNEDFRIMDFDREVENAGLSGVGNDKVKTLFLKCKRNCDFINRHFPVEN